MTNASAQQPGNQAKVGHHYRLDDHYDVGREKVREYARAVQDFHPAHWREDDAERLGYEGLVTPSTFTSIPAMNANRRLFESVITGYETYVQTEQAFEFYRPIVAGDRLVSDVELSSFRQVAGRDLLTVTNTFSDTSGKVVHRMHTTVLGLNAEDVEPGIADAVADTAMHGIRFRGSDDEPDDDQNDPSSIARALSTQIEGGVTNPLSDVSRTRTPNTTVSFDDLSVGDELPARKVSVNRGDLVNYAGVSGDANPIHWHEHVAGLAGLPDVIAHGMLTLGLGAGFVTSWAGDPGVILRYAVRLSTYTVVKSMEPGEVEFTGRIKSLDPETRTAVVVITAKSAGKKIFGLATAEIRLS